MITVVIAAVLAGCVHGTPDDPGPAEEAEAPDEAVEGDTDNDLVHVAVEDNAFTPETIQAAPGQEIMFQNTGQNTHTVTIPDAGLDHELSPGEIITVTIHAEGTYDLDCTFHDGMDGEITITG